MICYLDRTFCMNPNCTCGRQITSKELQNAAKWWSENNLTGLPRIAFADLCGPKEPVECK